MHQLSVSLEDMYNGSVRKLALQKNVICDGCDGIGGKAGAVQKCPNCRGTGMQVLHTCIQNPHCTVHTEH